MAGLQADMSNEFLRSFLSETVYLVEEDISVPAPSDIEPQQQNHATGEQMMEEPAVPKAPEPNTKTHQSALPKIPKAEPVAPTGKFRVIGKNNKGVIVLVTLPDEQFQRLPNLGFLQKILSAIGLKSDDVAYLNNVSGAIARFEDLREEMQVNYIISFASRLDTDLPHEKFTLYNPVKVGGVPVMFSLALEKLEHDQEQKKLLWGALQHMFLQ